MARNYMLLYGKNSVLERLKANPASIKKVFMQDTFNMPEAEKLIEENNLPSERLSSRDLARIRNSKDLQGIVAKVNLFEYVCFSDLLARPENERLTFIFLDKINDPQNLGVIIRTAACFGGFTVVIPKFGACEVNETVLHVASGGENYIPISMVSNISQALIAARKTGYWIVGTDVSDEAEDINKISLPFPLGLVLGSEGGGVSYGVKKRVDVQVRIPMKGARLSFNVSMACAILCHEISRQRKPSA